MCAWPLVRGSSLYSALLWNTFDVANECVKTPAAADCWDALSALGNSDFNNGLRQCVVHTQTIGAGTEQKCFTETFNFDRINNNSFNGIGARIKLHFVR